MIGVAPEPEASLDPDVLERLEGVETTLNQILKRLHKMKPARIRSRKRSQSKLQQTRIRDKRS